MNEEVSHYTDEIPITSAYDKPKYAITERTSMSDEKHFQKLLTECELGDKSHSQLLHI